MNTKEDNLLVKAIKKSVGLPTGGAKCGCGAPAVRANDCCKAEATESTSEDCGCGVAQSQGQEPPEPS